MMPACMCVSVCLCVCKQDNSKSCGWISMIFGVGVEGWTGKK